MTDVNNNLLPQRGPLPAPLYDVAEIADYLGVTPQWVSGHIRRLQLGCKRCSRWKLARVEAQMLGEVKDRARPGRPVG